MVSRSPHRPLTAPRAPVAWMTASVALVLLSSTLLTMLAAHTPWTGLDLRATAAHPAQILVVGTNGPSTDIPAGTQLQRIGSQGHWMALDGTDLTPEPDTRFVELAAFHDFLERQTALSVVLAGPEICVEAVSLQQWCFTPLVQRPLSDLPATFWLQLAVGGIGALVGAGVWAFRRDDTAARYVGITGLALLASAGAAAVYSSRELALDGTLFRALHLVNGAGALLFCAAFAATLWHYPQRLGRAPVGRMLIAAYGLGFVLLAIGVMPDFDLALRLPILGGFLLTAAFAVGQWRRSRGRPLDRAALMWFLLAWLGGGGAFLAVVFVPPLLGRDSGAHQAYAFALFLGIYGGLALGVLRYRLFDLDRWWFTAWTVVLGGVIFVALDLLIVQQLGMAGDDAMLISLLIVSWLYLPLRHWLWQRFRGRRHSIEVALSALAAAHMRSPGGAWHAVAEQLFLPLRIADAQPAPRQAEIADQGTALLLPPIGGGAGLRLELADRGRRLFSADDLRNAAAAQTIVERIHAYRGAIDQGARQERERIARALHDDVGAALLSLLHQSEGAAREQARRALAELRLVLQGLAAHGQMLEDILGWCRGDLREYADAADVALEWHIADPLPHASLEAHQALLLQRCLRELVDLAGPAATLRVSLTADTAQLAIDASVDALASPAAGTPLGALQQRARGLEIRMIATIESPAGLRARLEIPLIEPTPE